MESVEDAIEAIKPYVGQSGTCDTETALQGLNEARQLLWNKTQYPTTIEYLAISCSPQCFYMPSAYKQLIAAWIGNSSVSLNDEWYRTVPGSGLDRNNSCHKQMTDVGGFHVIFQNYSEPYQIAVP